MIEILIFCSFNRWKQAQKDKGDTNISIKADGVSMLLAATCTLDSESVVVWRFFAVLWVKVGDAREEEERDWPVSQLQRKKEPSQEQRQWCPIWRIRRNSIAHPWSSAVRSREYGMLILILMMNWIQVREEAIDRLVKILTKLAHEFFLLYDHTHTRLLQLLTLIWCKYEVFLLLFLMIEMISCV